MIVLCPRVWNKKFSLAEIQAQVSKKNKEDIDIDELSMSVASTYLHEIMHMVGVVANPESKLLRSYMYMHSARLLMSTTFSY